MLGTVASHLAVTAGHARKMKVIALLPELASHLLALYDTTQVPGCRRRRFRCRDICYLYCCFAIL